MGMQRVLGEGSEGALLVEVSGLWMRLTFYPNREPKDREFGFLSKFSAAPGY